jgi:hypothetical protein
MVVEVSGCVSSTPSPQGQPSTPSASDIAKRVIIEYSSTTTQQIGEWSKAKPGYVYLVLDLHIENQGYDSFSTNPLFFYVVVSNVKYSVAFVMGLEDELEVVDVLNRGEVRGKIAFEVPAEVSNTGYQIRYEAFKEYNIDWVKR